MIAVEDAPEMRATSRILVKFILGLEAIRPTTSTNPNLADYEDALIAFNIRFQPLLDHARERLRRYEQ